MYFEVLFINSANASLLTAVRMSLSIYDLSMSSIHVWYWRQVMNTLFQILYANHLHKVGLHCAIVHITIPSIFPLHTPMYNVIHASFCSVQSANDSFDLRFEMKGAVRERLGVLKCQCLKLFFKSGGWTSKWSIYVTSCFGNMTRSMNPTYFPFENFTREKFKEFKLYCR